MKEKYSSMKRRSIHKLLENFEKEAADEFKLLDATGPEFFSTHTLIELHGRCRERLALYQVIHKVGIIVGASSPIWLMVGCVFGALGWYFLATLSLLFFPLSLLLFGGLMLLLHLFYGGKDQLEAKKAQVRLELQRRQEEVARRRHSR